MAQDSLAADIETAPRAAGDLRRAAGEKRFRRGRAPQRLVNQSASTLLHCARSNDARFRAELAASVAVLAQNLQAGTLRAAHREGACEERRAILARASRSRTGRTGTIAFVA
jgi:hypothetical protein